MDCLICGGQYGGQTIEKKISHGFAKKGTKKNFAWLR